RYLLGGLVVLSVLLFLGQLAAAGLRMRQQARLQLLQTRHQEELSAAREEVARATERAARAAAEAAGNQTLRARHAAVLTALHEMWLGYPAPYTDDVELTYLIGTAADGDRVVEHRHTSPDRGASLPFLQGRLTAPTALDAETVTLAEVDMVTRSEDDRTAIRQIALTEKPGLLRCMFVFTPSIAEPTGWYARYRMRGMWDTLRGTGHDRLTWTPSPRVADPARSTLARLTVNFDFPPEAGDDVFVRDRDNRELKRLTGPDGSLRYRWTCDEPQPERYSWELWWARPLDPDDHAPAA
ncbi:MAG TPA: hypothetical protein VE547_10325, partial [Mycobacteriales bacterium]|nr:hypothetical protein [Mycobacteriales bacterium]